MYDVEFDRAEVMLGLLSQHNAMQRFGSDDTMRWRVRSRWFGRSTWRSAHSHSNPVTDFEGELDTDGASWGPLRAGLFGET